MHRIELKVSPSLERAAHRYMATLKYYAGVEVTFTDALKLLFAEATNADVKISHKKPLKRDRDHVMDYIVLFRQVERKMKTCKMK